MWGYRNKKIDSWFTEFLGVPCSLVRMPAPKSSKKSFSNESAFLLTSEKSLENVNREIAKRKKAADVKMSSFRPNLCLSGGYAFMDDDMELVQIGTQVFRVKL